MSLSFSISVPTTQFSFSKSLTSQNPFFLYLNTPPIPRKTTIIRMGGGPRTYPGGVSKWQWKRMQAKKAKQLLKARLCRERQIYEMRKRAELKAAVSELERPWEIVERAPNLFSVKADEQVKVLADRFQKAGGFDLWSDDDGPQLFQTPDGLPSARFFPKGVVHSVKPYGLVSEGIAEVGFDDESESGDKDGFFSDSKTDDEDLLGSDSDSASGYKGSRRRNGGEMWKQRRSGVRSGIGSLRSRKERGDGALMKLGETKNTRSHNDASVNRNGGLRNSRYYESGDGALMQHGKTNNTRSENDGRISRNAGLRNSRYSHSGNGALMQRGEAKTNRSRNDGRFSESGGSRNYRYSDAGNGALIQGSDAKSNRSRNDGRLSQSGGLRNSRHSSGYGDGALLQHGETKTNKSKNDGRINRRGGLRSSRYSSDSEVFDMSLQQDGSYGFQAKNRRFESSSRAP